MTLMVMLLELIRRQKLPRDTDTRIWSLLLRGTKTGLVFTRWMEEAEISGKIRESEISISLNLICNATEQNCLVDTLTRNKIVRIFFYFFHFKFSLNFPTRGELRRRLDERQWFGRRQIVSWWIWQQGLGILWPAKPSHLWCRDFAETYEDVL